MVEFQRKLNLDIRLSILKPHFMQWILKSMDFFKSTEGTQLILKGVALAGMEICWDIKFQEEALNTTGLNLSEIDIFTPERNQFTKAEKEDEITDSDSVEYGDHSETDSLEYDDSESDSAGSDDEKLDQVQVNINQSL